MPLTSARSDQIRKMRRGCTCKTYKTQFCRFCRFVVSSFSYYFIQSGSRGPMCIRFRVSRNTRSRWYQTIKTYCWDQEFWTRN